MDDELSEWTDGNDMNCQMLVVCHSIWYDADRPERGFSLGRVIARLVPEVQTEFPLRMPRLFAYAQLFGAAGDHTLRVVVLAVGQSDIGEEVVTHLGEDGEALEYGPYHVELISEDYLFEITFPLAQLRFPTPGIYEVQLHLESELESEPIARTRFQVMERVS